MLASLNIKERHSSSMTRIKSVKKYRICCSTHVIVAAGQLKKSL
jgi:hypothetical protein